MKLRTLFTNIDYEKFLILAGFILSVIFFAVQHFLNTGWDFMVYSLNSGYFFGHGSFFEWTRPPLMPFIMSILSFITFGSVKAAEYLYLVIVASIYLFASVKLADKLKVNRAVFYIISLCPFLLTYGLSEGTELLSLSLIMLFLTYLGEKKAPLFLALACLARYTNIIFLLLLLFRKDWKNIFRDFAIFLLGIAPWAIFSLVKTGNIMTGPMNSYALTVAFRSYLSSAADITHFFILSWLPIIAIFGIYSILKNRNKAPYVLPVLLMVFVLITGLMQYGLAIIKVERYLFSLVLPLSYFSAVALQHIKIRKLLIGLCILLLILSLGYSVNRSLEMHKVLINAESYSDYIQDNIQYIGDCSISSNAHIYLNYEGIPSESFPDSRLLDKKISEGYRVILFKSLPEPEYTFNASFLSEMNPIFQDETAVIIGHPDKCSGEIDLDITYLERINALYMETQGMPFEVSFYELFFENKQP